MIKFPTSPKHSPDRRQFDVARQTAVDTKYLQLRRSILLVLRKNLPAINRSVLQHSTSLRNNLFPVVAIVNSSLRYEHPIPRSIFIGKDVNPPVVNRRAVQKILAGSDARRRRAFLQVHQEQLALGPALRHRDQQQAPIVVETHTRPSLRIAPLAKNQRILLLISPQFVIKHMPVISFLPLRNIPLLGIPSVIKPRVVERPRNASRPRPLNRIRQQPP